MQERHFEALRTPFLAPKNGTFAGNSLANSSHKRHLCRQKAAFRAKEEENDASLNSISRIFRNAFSGEFCLQSLPMLITLCLIPKIEVNRYTPNYEQKYLFFRRNL